MKIIRKIFHLPDLDASRQQLKEAEEENERLQDYIVERQKQLSEVDLNKTIDMIKKLENILTNIKTKHHGRAKTMGIATYSNMFNPNANKT